LAHKYPGELKRTPKIAQILNNFSCSRSDLPPAAARSMPAASVLSVQQTRTP